MEERVLGAGVEIARDELAGDLCEKREGVAQGDVFAKGDEVHLAVNVDALAVAGEACGDIVIALARRRKEGAQDEVRVGAGGDLLEPGEGIGIEEIGESGGLGPEEELGLPGEGGMGQGVVPVVDLLDMDGVRFPGLGYIGLNGGEAEGMVSPPEAGGRSMGCQRAWTP